MPLNNSPKNTRHELVLIAEDELEISDILQGYLKKSGFRTLVASNGLQALQLVRTHQPNLLLLDVRMPHKDGWQVLTELRRDSQMPVIMLTAFDQDIDMLTGLRLGADDYIVKPFNPAVVVAKVQSVLRRSGIGTQVPVIHHGQLSVFPLTYELKSKLGDKEQVIDLTLTEFKLLLTLLEAKNKAFSRDELLALCMPEGEALARTVDSHVSKLRKKLEHAGIHQPIISIRGVGYRLGDCT